MIRRLPIPMSLLDPQVDDVRTPFDYAAPSLNVAKKRDWRASVFDRLIPQGDANMSDEDKTRATRQGLLQLAMGLQSSPNFGEALTKGLSGGLLSMNQGVDDLQNRQYKQQLLQARTGDPTEFRALDMQARAAGYEPGTPGYQHFMRVRGGLESKASSAGYKFDTVTGADMKPRIQRSNPNTGEVEIYDETIGDFVPVGQSSVPSTGVPVPAPTTGAGGAMMGDAIQAVESAGNPNAVSPVGARGLMQLMPATAREIEQQLGMPPGETDRNPEANRKAGEFYYQQQLKRFGDPRLALAAYNGGPNRLAGNLSAAGGNPEAALARMPAETRAYVPKVMARANPALAVGPGKAAEAGAVRAAEANVDLSMKPRIEAATAIAGAQGKAQGEASVAGMAANTGATIEAATTNAKDAGEQFSQLRAKAQMAQSENSKLQFLRSALGKTYTGTGANAVLGAKKFAASLGFQVDGLGDAEAAKALGNQLALSLRNPAGGEGMPGAMSDADRAFLMSSVPTLQNSPQGWRAMIDMKVALNAAAIRQAKEAERLRMSGVPIQDIPMKLQEWAAKHPVFQQKQAPHRGNPEDDALIAKYAH